MASINGPPPVFDPVKKEARYLNKNGDMTVVTFDSRNVAKVSLVQSWMNTANYGPVNGFSKADNNYFVSFYDPTKNTAVDGIVSATLVNSPVPISAAGIYNIVQKSSRGRNGNVYMRTDGTIAYIPNGGLSYVNGEATVVVNGKTVNITIVVGGGFDPEFVNFFLSIPVGQQPKPDGSSPSEIIRCSRVPTPGIAAISQRDAVAMITAGNKAFPDEKTQTDYRTAVPGVFAITPFGPLGLHVTGTGVPAGEMIYFPTSIGLDPSTGEPNSRFNARYTPLIAFNGNILVLAVDNKIMWVSTTNVKYAQIIPNNYESTQTRGYVTSLCIAANAIYYTTTLTQYGEDDGLFRLRIYTRQEEKVQTGYALRVIGVVTNEVSKSNNIATQIYVARCTLDYNVDLTRYKIEDFTVLQRSYPSDGYPLDGQCFKSLSWPLCYPGGNVAPCSTAAGDDAKKCCLTDSGAACPPAWTALPSDDYCTDFFGGRRNKCMRDR